MSYEKLGPIQLWAKKINWANRVKAVCKPCWEIKYCPYGILVETFPLSEEFTEKSCKIYGHDCPVFYVAEPFTETKELRKVTRHIPRATQFRVLKRENQICQICVKSVKDEDIEFDHVIPWSKGGSSDESNIRLLCSSCNRKRSNHFEDEYLVQDFSEHISKPPMEPDDFIIDFLKEVAKFGHQFYQNEGRFPNADDFAKCLGEGEKTIAEIKGAEHLNDLIEFSQNNKPFELDNLTFEALKYRWGFIDRKVHSLENAAKKYRVGVQDLLLIEKDLFKRMGIEVKESTVINNKWLKK